MDGNGGLYTESVRSVSSHPCVQLARETDNEEANGSFEVGSLFKCLGQPLAHSLGTLTFLIFL